MNAPTDASASSRNSARWFSARSSRVFPQASVGLRASEDGGTTGGAGVAFPAGAGSAGGALVVQWPGRCSVDPGMRGKDSE